MTAVDWLRNVIGEDPNRRLYDSGHPAFDRINSHGADFFAPYLRPGMALLHIGCRDGAATLAFAELVAPGPVTGIDSDPALIRTARKKAVNLGENRFNFERAAPESLPFANNRFDAVFVGQVLERSDRPEQALAEVFRVLRPGGLLGTRNRVASSRVSNFGSASLDRALKDEAAMIRDTGGDPDFGLRQSRLARNAGFVNLRTTSSTGHMDQEALRRSLAESEAVTAGGNAAGSQHAPFEEDDERDLFVVTVNIETVGWKPAL